MSISPEFLDLCRAQLKLLVQGLGVSFGIVYLTAEGRFEDGAPALDPVAAYPETLARSAGRLALSAASQSGFGQANSEGRPPRGNRDVAESQPESVLMRVIEQIDVSAEGPLSNALSALPNSPVEVFGEASAAHSASADASLEPVSHGQIVIPLTYSDLVLGVLVLARVNQTWTASEQHQVEQVAQTLAAGCVIDRRTQWLNQKLREQHLAYEAFHQQQDNMLDTLLHQLRNPLTAVQTFGKLLLRRVQPGDTNRSAAEGIVRESDRIRLLLEQFDQVMAPMPLTLPGSSGDDAVASGLDAGSLDAGSLNTVDINAAAMNATPPEGVSSSTVSSSQVLTGGALALAPLSLDAVLEPLLLTITAIAQERQISLHTDPAEPRHAPRVLADAGALQEVLSNLLDNAVKYTPEGGYVEVRTGLSQGELQTILIADTGPGIPLEDRQHLFERHFRGVQAEGDIPGTGLGLAIAQELVQQMDGVLEVYSPARESQMLSQNYPSHEAGTAIVLQLPSA